ncbi:MAG: sugar MFS transporter, partial [Chlorobi bacterium]|nr:sugar MFS transporter [Chlorobiota bacterium]
VADSFGVHLSYIVPVFSYIYIAFYGLNGYKPFNRNGRRESAVSAKV